MRLSIAALVIALFPWMSTPVFAQTETPQTNQARPNFVKDIINDEVTIWTSPLKIRRADIKWLAPVGVTAAALFASDWRVSTIVRKDEDIRRPSKVLSNLGNTYSLAATTGSMWAIGKLVRNEKAAETGRLGLEAVLNTQVVIVGLKMAAGRERPDKLDGHGHFLQGGRSFPSGHTAQSFAFASIIARQYRDKTPVVIGSYSLAAAVGLSRIGSLKHFPSDVLIGATIGELIGRLVQRHAR